MFTNQLGITQSDITAGLRSAIARELAEAESILKHITDERQLPSDIDEQQGWVNAMSYIQQQLTLIDSEPAGQQYWFSEMGVWGSNPVETYEFSSEHHANMWHIFDEVSQYDLGDFMRFLQDKGHAYDGEGTADDWQHVCVACRLLADEFNERAN